MIFLPQPAYTDDLALLHSSRDWKRLEETLSQDMATFSDYLKTWRLKFSHAKTVNAAFHLHDWEAKHKLKLYANGKLWSFCPIPAYLGVKRDRSLTFRHHLETSRKKLATRVVLLRRLAGSEWNAGAKTLRTSALSLVHSTAEYCVLRQWTTCHSFQASSQRSFATWERHPPWPSVASWAQIIFYIVN